MKIELNSLGLEDLRDLMAELGEQRFRAEQVFRFLNQNYGTNLEEASNLSGKLIKKLSEVSYINKMSILKRLDSKIDNTMKYLMLLEDQNIIETVLMKYKHGYSICLSTQIGCKMGCKFCASTKDGIVRNLSPGEMLNQIYLVEKNLNIKISNIVLMGSGEPLDNYNNTIKFMEIIHDPLGHNISYRNITLSTCGLVPKIYDLARENLPITLSISLHSPFDEDRTKIMPIAKKYKLEELMEACRAYIATTNRRITFEYTLIEGKNDRKEDVEELIRLIKGMNAHVNLIPLNPIKEYDENAPGQRSIEKIEKILNANNIKATIRQEKGSDISGSCGQLRRDYLV